MEEWDAHTQGSGGLPSDLLHRVWSQKLLHINVLEIRAVLLMLIKLKETVSSQVEHIESHNMITVAYINKEGGVLSRPLNQETILI